MNLNVEESYPEMIKNFQEISHHFIGLKPSMFGYLGGFGQLYILVPKLPRYFLFKFMFTEYFKKTSDWIFEGFKFDLLVEGPALHKYKISDRDEFEVICSVFGIYEMTDGIIVDESESSLNISKNERLVCSATPQKITEYLTPLLGCEGLFLKYSRWNQTIFLKLRNASQPQINFLVFYHCQYFDIKTGWSFNLNDTLIFQDGDNLTIQAPNGKFLVKCQHLEIWSKEQEFEYDMGLYQQFGPEHGFGSRKLIRSVAEL
jgi:hypothetical protein